MPEELTRVEDSENTQHISREPGEPPGTLEDLPEAPPTQMQLYGYDGGEYEFLQPDSTDEIHRARQDWSVVWLNVEGVGDADILRSIGDEFDFHPLLLEDMQNTPQRPKQESFDGRLYVIALMATQPEESIVIEHVGIYAGEGFVVTFQQTPGDSLDPVRQRIRSGTGMLRNSGADYLAYAVLDAIIDGYYPLLERAAAELARIEEEIVHSREGELIQNIHSLKSTLFDLQRAARPQRDMVQSIVRTPGSVVDEETVRYFGDCHDHAVHITETTESYRQMAGSLLDFYVSIASHRMNEVMKVLTIIATIFIPLTFVVGIYGMNFDPQASPWNMPELQWRYGYPVVMGSMAVIALLLVWYFRRKGWIGAGRAT